MERQEILRRIPKVDELMQREAILALREELPTAAVRAAVRSELEALRQAILAGEIRERYPEKTIWLYTGYRWEEIRDLEVMAYVDVVVDGRYIQEERDVTLEWKGSANQRVIDVPMTRKLGQIVLHA